jgi:hypothetical protein
MLGPRRSMRIVLWLTRSCMECFRSGRWSASASAGPRSVTLLDPCRARQQGAWWMTFAIGRYRPQAATEQVVEAMEQVRIASQQVSTTSQELALSSGAQATMAGDLEQASGMVPARPGGNGRHQPAGGSADLRG